MNICLINPADNSSKKTNLELDIMKRYFTSSQTVSHLGLGYLHAVLEKEGHKVITVEMLLQDINTNDIEETLFINNIQLVGISSFLHNVKSTLKLATLIKKKFPEIFVVLGGYLPTLSPEKVLLNASVDVCVIGEGEETLKELVYKIENRLSWKDTDGIAFLKNDNKLQYTRPRKLIENLNTLPFPNRLWSNNKSTVNLITSRGCYGNCSFCAINAFYRKCVGAKVRRRSPENVVSEILMLVNEYGVNRVKFHDDNFAISSHNDRTWFMRFYELIKNSKIKINYWCDIRANEIVASPDLIAKFVEIGLDKIAIGLESLVEEQLKFYNKQITVEQNIHALKIVHSLNIYYNFNLIIFDPRSNLNEVIKFIKALKNINFLFTNENILFPAYGTIMAYEGTEIREYVEKHNLLSNNYHYYEFMNEEIKQCYDARYKWEKSMVDFDNYNSIYDVSKIYSNEAITKQIYNLYKEVYYMDLDSFLFICKQIQNGYSDYYLFASVEERFSGLRDSYIKQLLFLVKQIKVDMTNK